MPTYDYECDGCGHKFEHYQGINDALLKDCPECGKAKLRRLLGMGGAVVFKGSGFYQTDYRSDSYRKAAAAEKPSSGSSDSSSKTKSESTATKSTEKTQSSEKKPKTS